MSGNFASSAARHDEAALRDSFFELEPTALMERLKKESFFHDMMVGGQRTGSTVYRDTLPPNYHLWPAFKYLQELDLSGKRTLDIGAYDGMTAFVMAELGAERIDATCQYDLDRFRIVRALQKYQNIAYYPKTDIDGIATSLGLAQYDLVVISAMMHHLTAPLDALLSVRRLLRRDGCFILESIFIDQEAPALFLNTELEDPVYGAPTLFVPTLPALRGMLRFASFDIISETRLLGGGAARETNYERVTFLARARRPSEVKGRSAKAVEIHRHPLALGSMTFSELEADSSPASDIQFSGDEGARTLNIWLEDATVPLQPRTQHTPQNVGTLLTTGKESRFITLTAAHPDGAFTLDDIHLMGARYPGEAMPEGMAWGLKQFGNLHVLDYVKKLGLRDVLEVGPGFNLYFVHHLPKWCTYVGLDASGFYDDNIMRLANQARSHARTIDALLGATESVLSSESFDACISVSVLEHVPRPDIAKVCADMFRVLRPGGWAVHSIDGRAGSLPQIGSRWLTYMRNAGFHIDDATIDQAFGGIAPEPADDPLFNEPLSLRARFSQGHLRSIWGKRDLAPPTLTGTILVAAQKPRA